MKNTGCALQIFPVSKHTVFFKGITVEFMMGSLYFVVIILNKMSHNQYQIMAVLNKASMRTRKSLPPFQNILASTQSYDHLDPAVGSEHRQKGECFSCSLNLCFSFWEVSLGRDPLTSYEHPAPGSLECIRSFWMFCHKNKCSWREPP